MVLCIDNGIAIFSVVNITLVVLDVELCSVREFLIEQKTIELPLAPTVTAICHQSVCGRNSLNSNGVVLEVESEVIGISLAHAIRVSIII